MLELNDDCFACFDCFDCFGGFDPLGCVGVFLGSANLIRILIGRRFLRLALGIQGHKLPMLSRTRVPLTFPAVYNKDSMLAALSMDSSDVAKLQRLQRSEPKLQAARSLLLGWLHLAHSS
jgi:hypothetical protein